MNIEFIEPKLPSRKAWILVGIAWVLVLILGITNLYLRSRLAHDLEAQPAAEAMTKTPTAVAPSRVVPPYQEDALAALKRAALPEADALAELEHVAVIGIQLRSIDVNPAASEVVVELDAISDEVLGDYVDQLNAGMPTAKWHIKRISAMSDGSSNISNMTRSSTIAREIL